MCLYTQSTVSSTYKTLPQLTLTVKASNGTLEYRDLISQLIMEVLSIFAEEREEEGGGEEERGEESSMEEGLGVGDGSGSLGSLNTSFPHQVSISSSTGGSGN